MKARSYNEVDGWRRYQPLLPAHLRAVEGHLPTEEYVNVGDCSVHVDRWPAPDAPLTVIALHGGGGHGRMMAPLCRMVTAAGYEAVAPDLPLYGLTHVPDPAEVSYSTWIEVVALLVKREAQRRPVVLFGASMGGRLAYDAAAATRTPVGVIATCLIDPRPADVRRLLARNKMSAALLPVLQRLPRPLRRVKVPMPLVSRMSAMSNTPALSRACARDRQGGGTSAPLGFLLDWLQAAPYVEPEDFDVCPVLLVHPRQDRWTPPTMSLDFLNRMRAPHHAVLLDNAGHFPIEQPGLDQMHRAVVEFLAQLVAQPQQNHEGGGGQPLLDTDGSRSRRLPYLAGVSKPPPDRPFFPDTWANLLIYAAFLTAFMLLVLGLLLGRWSAAFGGVLGGCAVLLFEGAKNVKQRETEGRESTWRWWPNKTG